MFPYVDRYQKEAYWALMKIARQHGGAFLCDGVGLGKTFVGLMLIERLILHDGKRVVLFAPKAAKEGVWEPHLRRWLPHIGGVGGGADFSNPAVFSHTDLGRKGDFPGRFQRIAELADVVVIDEAHHFRNPGRGGDPDRGIEPWRPTAGLLRRTGGRRHVCQGALAMNRRRGFSTRVLLSRSGPTRDGFGCRLACGSPRRPIAPACAHAEVAAPDVDGETPELGGGAGRGRGREAEQILVAQVAGEGRQRPFQPVEPVDGEDLAAADVGQAPCDLAHLAHLGTPAEGHHVERRVRFLDAPLYRLEAGEARPIVAIGEHQHRLPLRLAPQQSQ